MKKSKRLLFFFSFLFTVILSCNTPDKLLVKQDGVWKIKTHRARVTLGDSLLSDSATLGESILFNENLTGAWIHGDTDSVAFNWYYNPEKDQITTLITDSSGVWEPRVWDIHISTKKTQKWETLFISYYFQDSLTLKSAETLDLEKLD